MPEPAVAETTEIAPFDIEELTKQSIGLMRKQSLEMEVGEDGSGYPQIKAAHIQAKHLKKSVKDRHKELKDEHLKKCQEYDAQKRNINSVLDPIIDTLAGKRKAWDDIAIIAEEKRIARIKQCISDIEGPAVIPVSWTVDDMKAVWADLDQMKITEENYQEFYDDAIVARDAACDKLRTAFEAKIEQNKADAARKIEDERLAKIAKEQKETALKLLEAQEEIDRKAKEAQDELDAMRKVFEAEKATIAKAKQDEIDAKEKADREAQEKIDAEKAEADRKARIEVLKPDKDKIGFWAGAIYKITPPEVESIEAQHLLCDAAMKINQIINDLVRDAENL